MWKIFSGRLNGLNASKTSLLIVLFILILNICIKGESSGIENNIQIEIETESHNGGVFAKNSETDAADPNIILIVIDTTRADHLSTYGYARDTSPNITDLASVSVVFSNAISAAPWTLPSYASLLRGKLAFNHELNSPYYKGSGGTDTTMQSLLGYAGYHTISVQTNHFLKYLDTTFDKRFRIFDSDYELPADGINYLDKLDYLDKYAIFRTLTWLNNDNNIDKEFFMFIGLLSPHWKYICKNGYLDDYVKDDLWESSDAEIITFEDSTYGITYDDLPQKVQKILGEPKNDLGYHQDSRLYIAAYDSEITYSDYYIGKLLNTLKEKNLFDNSIIILTADHGENMVEHSNNFLHGNSLFNSLIHVPLIIKFPRQTTQKIITNYVRTIDILPTILDYLGLNTGKMDGKSLIPIIDGDDVDYDERPVISYYVDTIDGKRYVCIIKNNYKLIVNQDWEDGDSADEYQLYNLSKDPEEKNNIASEYSGIVDRLKSYLEQYYEFD